MKYHSEHFNGKIFLNPVPTEVMVRGAGWRMLRKLMQKHPNREPAVSPGPFQVDMEMLHNLPAGALRITWLGHSSTLIEIDGKRFLTDPLWTDRASPFRFIGPKRFFENPLALEELPPIDYILLSHDHYDHLDRESIIELTNRGIPVITMLGVGDMLVEWGINKNLVTQLDWWQDVKPGEGFTVTALPSRHFSGRGLTNRFKTLWGAFAIKGPVHNVFFGSDSGYYHGFKQIGEHFGPFDITMLDTGAYNEEWPWIHMGPENAVKAHRDLKGDLLLPIHWGTFNLAFHPWTEPVERVIAAAEASGVSLLIPAPGETRWYHEGAYISGWWKEV